jgi:DNA repair exonuclease SbcCD ATPase subunit
MILLEKIALRNFGKYSDAAFDFGETTVFRGDNESGKTTIFDALFKTMSDVDGRASELSRYEDTRGVEPQWTHDAKPLARTMGKSEFLSLYAIRAGDVSFDLKPGVSWIQQVTAKLFAGGITPAEVIDVLSKHYASSNKAQHFMKALTPLERDLKTLRDKRGEAENEREKLLQEEKTNDVLKQQLNEISQKISDLNKSLTELAAEIDKGDKIVRCAECSDTLKLVNKIRHVKEGMKKLYLVERDESEDLKRLETSFAAAKSKLQQATDLRGQRLEDHKRISGEIREKDSVLSANKRRAESAEDSVYRLNEATDTAVIPKVNITMLIFAFVLLAAGCTLAALMLPGILRWIGIGASGIAGGLLLFVAKGKSSATPVHPAINIIAGIKDEWITAFGDLTIKELSRKSSVLAFLNKQISEFQTEQALIGKLEENKKKITTEIENYQAEIMQTESDVRTRQGDLDSWYKNHGISNTGEYNKVRQEYVSLEALHAENDKQAKERNIADLDETENQCRRILKDFEEQGIPKTGCTKEELDGKRKWHSKLIDDLSKHTAVQTELTAITSKSAGESIARIDFQTQQIVHLRKKIVEAEAKQKSLKLDHEAAKTAIEIFKRIESDSQAKLESLGNEISAILNVITPSSGTVRVNALDSNQLSCADAGGCVRPITDLSSGAYDTFFFAARLALAKKHADGPHILVLDEPFSSLDETRESRMIDLLKEFRQQNNWQVVLFTKEKRLAQCMKIECKARVYEYDDGEWKLQVDS